MIDIRPIQITDAESFLALCLTLDHESDFMMFEPGERTTTIAEQRHHIQSVLDAPNQTIIVAADGRDLVGYIALTGDPYRRVRHVAYIVAGIRASHAGQGLGSALFREAIAWARSAAISRLELTVMTHNEPAIRLYQRQGFEIEGTRRNAMRVNGRYIDEFYMSRLLASDD